MKLIKESTFKKLNKINLLMVKGGGIKPEFVLKTGGGDTDSGGGKSTGGGSSSGW